MRSTTYKSLSRSSSSVSMAGSTKSQLSELTHSSPYHSLLASQHDTFPHLKSLSLYIEATRRQRESGRLGSFESDSILCAEFLVNGEHCYTRIDCFDSDHIGRHNALLSGTGDKDSILARVLIVEDLSPAAIEVLGTGFGLDPHMFYFHLGFDTRRSAMLNLVSASSESAIPVTWCMPSHAPENYISIPVPCDLKPVCERKLESGLQEDSTYSRQTFRAIAQVESKENLWEPPERAFQRLSLIFPDTDIETVIILAFPMWKRLAQNLSGEQMWPCTKHVIDSYGFGFITPSASSRGPRISSSAARGGWSETRWMRVSPLIQYLGCSSPSRLTPRLIKERSLLWLYSKMNHNYFLACQNEGRCWRDIRALLDTTHLEPTTSQRPKRQFRDSMTKTAELLEIAVDWLNRSLVVVTDMETFNSLRRKAEVTLSYEKARLGQVLLNINDYQAEIEMELMVSQLKENRHAIEQAISVGHLTKLAFIFVPLSTVCSAFGMNLKEMVNQGPTIWWFVGASIFGTIVAVVVSSSMVGRVLRAVLGNRNERVVK